jgi:hypothetical protein
MNSALLVNDIEVVVDKIRDGFVPLKVEFKKGLTRLCNCKIENNLFIRSKGCKLSKEEHKF